MQMVHSSKISLSDISDFLSILVKEINNNGLGQHTNYIQHMNEYVSKLSVTEEEIEDSFATISQVNNIQASIF